MNWSVVFGPLASAVVVGFAAWVAVKVSVARLDERMSASERHQAERHEANQKRFEKLEDSMTGGAIVPRHELEVRLANILADLAESKRSMEDLLRRVAHLEGERRQHD